MRTKCFKIAFLTLCLCFMGILSGQAATSLEDKAKSWMKRNGIPGAAIVVYDNGKIKKYSFGYADRENKKPVTEDTIFEIASLTKIFTAVLLAGEINSGSMKLSDSVTKYVSDITPSSRNKFNQITLENLATHTSGLPFNVPRSINSRTKLAKYLSSWKNPASVGASWLYSNVNLGLIGYALEKESQKSIYDLYAEKILHPLGMRTSNAMIPDGLLSFYAQGYNMAGNPAPRRNMKEWIKPPNSDWIFPATGALKSTPRDMALFLKAALRLPGTPAYIADAMKLTQTTFVQTTRFQQGLTWIIHPDPVKNKTKLLSAKIKGEFPANAYTKGDIFDGNALMEKTGASGGFRAYIAVIPNQQKGVVVMANRYITSTELVHMGRWVLLSNDILMQ